ncbi:4-hydroxylaminobenzoate lyase [Acidovorax sp. 22279]|uniref:4-hydroxylaminobenzoate lyase n=1 Tax=Acidovorax sp. 22279 TaxID=3453900 RepID=UPI003F84F25F
MSDKTAFHQALVDVTAQLAGKPLDAALAQWLNTMHGPTSATYQRLREACIQGAREGWLCEREGGGIRYGRVFKPEDALHRFSVDVVDMQNIAGPHHTHPQGEIDLIMPLEGEALFDGHPAGWCVYPPGSAHHPTVARGRALVLYLLPEGQIQFTR